MTPVPEANPLRAFLWRAAGRLVFRASPHVAHGFRRAVLRLFGARIAPTTKVRRSAQIDRPWNLTAGHLTIFGDDSVLRAAAPIRLGDRCVVSQLCVLSTERLLPSGDGAMERELAPITIEDDCWIAADSLVLPGATIRAGTVVGARSMVEGTLPGWSVCVGQPAARVKERAFTARPE